MGPHLVQPLSKSPTAITENSKASRRNIWKNYSVLAAILGPKTCYSQGLLFSSTERIDQPFGNSLGNPSQSLGLALHIEMRHQNEFTKCEQEYPDAPGVICDGL
jgi:hypothetical protein